MAVLLSKFLKPQHEFITCSELLLHKGQTCKQMFWWNLYRCSVGCLKYLLPIAISPIILRPKNLNVEMILNILRYYLEMSFWGATCVTATFSIICFFRKLFGKFYLYLTAFIPAYLGFQLTWFVPARTLNLASISTAQASLETWLCGHCPFIYRSLPIQTLIFMLSSAIILHAKRSKNFNGFWFMQPIKIESPPKNQENYENLEKAGVCLHTGTCYKFIWEGMLTYLFNGISLDVLRLVNQLKWPPKLCDLKLMRFQMTVFFLSYVGIYRYSSCFLARYINLSYGPLQHLLSAGLGGLSYIFWGQVTLCAFGVVVATQAAWQCYCYKQNNQKDKDKVYLFLARIPFAKLLIPINAAYMAHNFMYNHKEISSLSKTLFRGVTDNRFHRIYQNYINNLAKN